MKPGPSGRRAARSWLPVAVLGLASCVEPDPAHEDSFQGSVAELTIDSGARADLAAGSGVGVTIEYLGEGHWTLTTLCDTRASGASCVFDILVSSDESESGIVSFEGVGLEPGDSVTAPDDFALQVDCETASDLDGVSFDTAPGATVRVSALLYDPDELSWAEWSDDPRLLSWIGHGALERGAPTNPVDLTPDQP